MGSVQLEAREMIETYNCEIVGLGLFRHVTFGHSTKSLLDFP